MKQLYLLPISLILMTQGFANTLNEENANSFVVVQEESLSDELNIEQLVSFSDYNEFDSRQSQEDSEYNEEQEHALLSDTEYDDEDYQPAPQPRTQRKSTPITKQQRNQPQSTRQVPAQARTSQRRQQAAAPVEAEIQENSNESREYSPQTRPSNKPALPQRNLSQRKAPVEAAQPVEEAAPSQANRAPAKVNRTQPARSQAQRQAPVVSQKNSVEPTTSQKKASVPSRQPARKAVPTEAATETPQRKASGPSRQPARRASPAQARTAQRQIPLDAETAQDDFSEPSNRGRPSQRSSQSTQRGQGRMQAQNNGYNTNRSSSQQMNKNGDQPTPSMDRSPDKLPEAINMPARPVLEDSWNCWLRGEALLWQAVQENMDYVYKGTDGPGTYVSRDIKKPHFNWDWGWRVGIGFNTPHDGWDLDFKWTHIENHAHGHTHQGNQSLFIVYSTESNAPVVSGTKASAHWNNTLNQADFDLGREFYVGRHLTLRPNAGVRSTWIHQHYNVNFHTAAEEQKAHMTSRFWGFGFFGGLDTDWELGRGFSIFGDAGMAILLGFFDVHQNGSQSGSSIYNIKKSQRTGRPILDLDLGLMWHSKFYSDRFAATLKVGYEYHLYFNQNPFMQSNGSSALELFNPINGDLAYQGVTFSAQFDF